MPVLLLRKLLGLPIEIKTVGKLLFDLVKEILKSGLSKFSFKTARLITSELPSMSSFKLTRIRLGVILTIRIKT